MCVNRSPDTCDLFQCGQHFDDGSSAGQHTTTDYNTSGGGGGATTQDAINRMDKLIEANRNNSNNNNKQKGGGAKTTAAVSTLELCVICFNQAQESLRILHVLNHLARFESAHHLGSTPVTTVRINREKILRPTYPKFIVETILNMS